MVELTWVTSARHGMETVVTVELAPLQEGTRVSLTHAGFPNAESRDQHEAAWLLVLAQMDQRIAA